MESHKPNNLTEIIKNDLSELKPNKHRSWLSSSMCQQQYPNLVNILQFFYVGKGSQDKAVYALSKSLINSICIKSFIDITEVFFLRAQQAA